VGPVAISASRAAFTQVSIEAGVFCNRNATGATARVLGTSSRVTEALAARIMLFDGGGLLDFLQPVPVKELE
jgi:hypothetical protein